MLVSALVFFPLIMKTLLLALSGGQINRAAVLTAQYSIPSSSVLPSRTLHFLASFHSLFVGVLTLT